MICLCLKIAENFVRLENGFCFMNIPFDCIVILKFLAQFPMDRLPDKAIPNPKLLLHYFAIFVGTGINCFLFVTTLSTLAILLRIMDFRFYYYISCMIFTQAYADKHLEDPKWQQVCSCLEDFLCILANLNYSVVWIVLILSLIFIYSNPFSSLCRPFQVHQLQMVSLSPS